jgi:hypothetical protein
MRAKGNRNCVSPQFPHASQENFYLRIIARFYIQDYPGRPGNDWNEWKLSNFLKTVTTLNCKKTEQKSDGKRRFGRT